MSLGALLFMAITWAAVLGLVGFCFARVLRGGGWKSGRDGRPAHRRR